MLDVSTLCFQAIQREYRNAVVKHIRVRFKEAFPDTWEEELESPFKKEWSSLKENAAIRRQSGEISTPLTDSFDLLGINHFANLFEKYFGVLFPHLEAYSENERKAARQSILSWARAIKNIRDPALGHPAEDDLDRRDALSLLDSAFRLLDFVNEEAASEVRLIWDTIDGREESETLPDPYQQPVIEGSTLPPREAIAPSFVGRQAELAELRSWLAEKYRPVYFLAGDGGKGKSAIAYEFATTVREDPPIDLEAVIWLSAKVRKFESGAMVTVDSPDFWDLPSALRVVLSAYGAVSYQNDDLESMSEATLEYMAQLPALIIIDDVDSLEDQNMEAMNFFLERTSATKSKVLFTTRRISFNFETRTTQVQGFRPGSEDGLRFIDSRLTLYGLDAKGFSRSEKNTILDACDGSPLYVQDLLRLCVVGETSSSAVRLWREYRGENARRYALGREFDMLSEDAQSVLLTCALFKGAASLPEIEAAAEIPLDSVHRAIEELQSLFLVSRPRLTGDTPRFDLDSNTRRLVLEVRGSTDLANRISRAIDAILGTAQTTPSQRKQVGQYVRQAVSQVKLDKHGDAETTLSSALSIYPENADLNGTLGWVYKQWKNSERYTDAQRYFSRSADLSSQSEEMYKHWAELEIERGEWTAAATAAERGLKALEHSSLLVYTAGYARSRLGRDLYRQGQEGRAEQEGRAAEDLFRMALRNVDDLPSGQYRLHGTTYRATALNYELLIQVAQMQGDSMSRIRFLNRLKETLDLWEAEHPGNLQMVREKERLQSRFTQ